jgi:L-lactate dehydrogenase complex protein LldG
MSARDEILAAVRRSLRVTGDEAPRRAAAQARLAQSPAGIIPRRGQGDAGKRAATFGKEATRAQASLAGVAEAADVPAEVARFLRENNLAAAVRMGEDARLSAMPWGATALEISRGPSDGHDLNAVSAAFAAVAESGTLALVSGPDNPTTLAFLPDNHIVVMFADDLVGDYESVFVKLRAVYGAGAAPRTVNFITGPSRSADIEETLLLGAHGPRRLHIVVVGAAREASAAEAGAEK